MWSIIYAQLEGTKKMVSGDPSNKVQSARSSKKEKIKGKVRFRPNSARFSAASKPAPQKRKFANNDDKDEQIDEEALKAERKGERMKRREKKWGRRKDPNSVEPIDKESERSITSSRSMLFQRTFDPAKAEDIFRRSPPQDTTVETTTSPFGKLFEYRKAKIHVAPLDSKAVQTAKERKQQRPESVSARVISAGKSPLSVASSSTRLFVSRSVPNSARGHGVKVQPQSPLTPNQDDCAESGTQLFVKSRNVHLPKVKAYSGQSRRDGLENFRRVVPIHVDKP